MMKITQEANSTLTKHTETKMHSSFAMMFQHTNRSRRKAHIFWLLLDVYQLNVLDNVLQLPVRHDLSTIAVLIHYKLLQKRFLSLCASTGNLCIFSSTHLHPKTSPRTIKNHDNDALKKAEDVSKLEKQKIFPKCRDSDALTNTQLDSKNSR